MPLDIFQWKISIEKKTSISMENRRAMEQTMPADETEIGFWYTIVNINQGSGSLLGL
jgi:hypothetical protein